MLTSRKTTTVFRTLFALLFILSSCIGGVGCALLPKHIDVDVDFASRPQQLAGVCHGQDIIGLVRQDYVAIAQHWEAGECLGVFDGTFGNAVGPVDMIVQHAVVPAVRWHLSFCNHGSSCLPSECKPTDLACLKNSAIKISQYHTRRPQTACYISPFAEYAEKDCGRVQSWFNTVRSAAPNCTMVASALPGACIPSGVLVERHGNSPGYGDIVSNDGSNYFDSDSITYNKLGTVMNLKWTPRDNLRLSSEKTAPPPPSQRPLTNRLGMQDLLQMQLMKRPMSPMPVPAWCPKFRALAHGELWKNHAEDYGANNDARGNKPLLIYSRRVGTMNLLNAAGQRVGCVKYYGTYPGNLFRLYVGSCSGDHAVDLYRKAGDWVFVKDGNTCIGLPTLRRAGFYRANRLLIKKHHTR